MAFYLFGKAILFNLPGLSGRWLLAKIISFFILIQLIFIIGGFTVFRFSYLENEGDLHLKSFVFAWTLRYLKDLHALFTKICKSCPNSFTLTVFCHHINDQRQLCNFFLTFGKLSYECLSACSARWLSIYIVRSLEGWYYVATCCSFPECKKMIPDLRATEYLRLLLWWRRQRMIWASMKTYVFDFICLQSYYLFYFSII